MSQADWIVLGLTLIAIILYGLYKSRTSHNLDGYFLSNRSMPWGLVLLSIMGTQASAVTFIGAPGQAYTEGMGFVQYYFGLPLAMVVICIFFVPIFNKMRVYTAYEYLEGRFDGKTRTLTSFLFLLQRGLSTGISVFAPSIILSSLLDWNIYVTNLFMGGLLIIYTMTGGAKAVAYTQQLQLVIIFIGMFLAGYMVVKMLPENVGFVDALKVSGELGRMNVIDSGITDKGVDWSGKYNLLSGIIGGFFLSLSYFGADQSQVGRYLTARSMKESKMGLIMNGFVKVPMQFLILLIGTLVFAYYQFNKAPIFFNDSIVKVAQSTPYADTLQKIEADYNAYGTVLTTWQSDHIRFRKEGNTEEAKQALDKITVANQYRDSLRSEYKQVLKKAVPASDTNDTNYVFFRFVVDHLPEGLIGLLVAVIFLASWGSIAAAINSLASCTVVDFHKKFAKNKKNGENDYQVSKRYTLLWGVFCIVVAMFTYNLGTSLIEAVNILGSLFYGVILGVFLVAFFCKNIRNANAVFWGAVVAELLVLTVFLLTKTSPPLIKMGFLWLNPIGAFGVILFSWVLNKIWFKNKPVTA